jgi:isoleucyl-tRNA synthetase
VILLSIFFRFFLQSAILKRIRNTLRFLLANVGDFDASRDLVPLGMYTVSPYERTRDSFVVCLIDVCAESMSPIDRYALHRTAVTVQAAVIHSNTHTKTRNIC